MAKEVTRKLKIVDNKILEEQTVVETAVTERVVDVATLQKEIVNLQNHINNANNVERIAIQNNATKKIAALDAKIAYWEDVIAKKTQQITEYTDLSKELVVDEPIDEPFIIKG